MEKTVSHTQGLISVVMPVYNGETYLRESIKSILNQTYSNFEFIIIDDGSRDGSLEIIQTYSKQDKRIRIVVNENNLGLARSLNIGVASAKGEFIARMDADDISLPDRLEKQVCFLSTHPEISILGGNQIIVDHDGKSVSCSLFSNQQSTIRWNMLLGNGVILSHPCVMIRRPFLLSIGGYCELKAAQDFELWSRTFAMDPLPIANLPDIVLYYRQHKNTITNLHNSSQEQVAIDTRKKTISLLLNRKISEEVVRSYRHTKFDFLSMEDNFQMWIEVFESFRARFRPERKDEEYIQQEILERMSKYLYLNPFTKTKKGRLSIWRARTILPHAIFHALILSKLGKRGAW